MSKFEFLNIEELDPNKNTINSIYDKLVNLLKKVDLNEDKQLIVTTDKTTYEKITEKQSLNHNLNDITIPNLWISEINLTPKIDTIDKFLINKNSFKTKEEFVMKYYQWIKENCYDNNIKWKSFSGEEKNFEFKTKEEYKGTFSILIYDF